jgi:hypothetical protein
MKKGSNMSELSILELEAQTGEVLPEREALSVVIGSFNRHTTINHNTTNNTTTTTVHTTTVTATDSSSATVTNSFASSAHSSASQSVSVNG